MIDLHTHSRQSDGQYAPAELVRRAASCGITHLALTDHDTTAGLHEAAKAAAEAGMTFFYGIEISTTLDNQHMLGLGIDPAHPAMQAMCRRLERRREVRIEGLLEILEQKGVPVEKERVLSFADGQVGRPHFALAMVEKGYVQSVAEAFERYLHCPEIRRMPDDKPTIEEAAAAVQAAGGIAVLAHPMELKMDADTLIKHLDKLRAIGIDGIEAYYQANTAAECAFLADYAKRHQMLVTGGSDFHGEAVKPDIQLGVAAAEAILAQPRLTALAAKKI